MGEVIDEGNGASVVGDCKVNNVATEAFWCPCLVLNHSPGAGVTVFGGHEVGHSGTKHSHQGTALGKVKSQGFLVAHSVFLHHLPVHHLQQTRHEVHVQRHLRKHQQPL